jgi:hypothetical protein
MSASEIMSPLPAVETAVRQDVTYRGVQVPLDARYQPFGIGRLARGPAAKKDVIGVKTSNYYLRDMKGFCRWLIRDRRTDTNPLAHLGSMTANTEKTRERRALSPDHFARLIGSTSKNRPNPGSP